MPCGSLASLSASDAVTTLTHEVRTLQMAGRKVSTLFLDIKGGFGNVKPSTLCSMLRAKGVNPYLVSRPSPSCLAGHPGSYTRGPPRCSPRFRLAPPRGPWSLQSCLLFTFPTSTARSPMVSPSLTWTTSVSRCHLRLIGATSRSYRGNTPG